MTSPSAADRPIILDVDTGIDDALALSYAIGTAGLDIVAVTTVAGNIDVYRATTNTLNVLSFLGREDIPVHRGATHPLARPHRAASHVHGEDGIGGADLPTSARPVDITPGPATIVRLARERPGELTLVAVGPLTNLAIALNVEPRLVDLIPRVVVMGGAYYVPGNITPHAEFNIWEDPEAAEQVFAAGFDDLTLIGLDVARQVSLRRADWDRLGRQANRSSSAELARRVTRMSFEDQGLEQTFLHDPLAVSVALDSTLVSVERSSVAIVTAGEADGQTRVTGAGTINVATGVDAERFLAGFHAGLEGADAGH